MGWLIIILAIAAVLFPVLFVTALLKAKKRVQETVKDIELYEAAIKVYQPEETANMIEEVLAAPYMKH